MTDAANHALSCPFIRTKVSDALSNMSPLKSPSTDGFPVLFYQKIVHVIKGNIIYSVLEFLNHRLLPTVVN